MLATWADDSVLGSLHSQEKQPAEDLLPTDFPSSSAKTKEQYGRDYRASSYSRLRRWRDIAYFVLVTAAMAASFILVLYHCRLAIRTERVSGLEGRSLASSEGGEEEKRLPGHVAAELCEEEEESIPATEGKPQNIVAGAAPQAGGTAEEDEPPKKKRKRTDVEETEPEAGPASSARTSEWLVDPVEDPNVPLDLPQWSAPGPSPERQQGPFHWEGGVSSSTTASVLEGSDLLWTDDWDEAIEKVLEAELEDWFLDPDTDLPFLPSTGPSDYGDDEPGAPQSDEDELWSNLMSLLEAAEKLQGKQHGTEGSSESEPSSTAPQASSYASGLGGPTPSQAKRKRTDSEETEEDAGQASSARTSEWLEDPSVPLDLPQWSATGPSPEQQQDLFHWEGEPFVVAAEAPQMPLASGKDVDSSPHVSAASTGGVSSSTTASVLEGSDLPGTDDWDEAIEKALDSELANWYLDPYTELPFLPSPGPSDHGDDEPGASQSDEEELWSNLMPLLEAAEELQGKQHGTEDSSEAEARSSPPQASYASGLGGPAPPHGRTTPTAEDDEASLSSSSAESSSAAAATSGSPTEQSPGSGVVESPLEGTSTRDRPDETSTHPYYRLPAVPSVPPLPSFIYHGGQYSVGRFSLAEILLPIRELLIKPQLCPHEVEELMQAACRLVISVKETLTAPVVGLPPSAALNMLGRRFIAADYIWCVCYLLGPAMNRHLWWGKLMSELVPPPEIMRPEKKPSKARLVANRLLAALNLYKDGIRPNAEEVVALKREIFCNPRFHRIFQLTCWNPWRHDDNRGEGSA